MFFFSSPAEAPNFQYTTNAEDELQGEVRQEEQHQQHGRRPGVLVDDQRNGPARGLERDDPMRALSFPCMLARVLHQYPAFLV